MTRKTFRKVITSDECIEKIHKKNKEFITKFLKDKNMRSSDLTISNYQSDLNIFFCWNVEYNENKIFTDVKKLEISDFFIFCTEELRWGSARINRMRSCLSSFSVFLERFYDEDYPNFKNRILVAVETMPKNEVREKTILSEEQIDSLFTYLKENNMKQEACWLALAIASGARLSELFRFDIDILDENHTAFNGLFMETLKTIKTKGRTKNGKMIYKYIIRDIFLPYYKDWLEERENILSKHNVDDHLSLFIQLDGKPATIPVIRNWITKFEKVLGVDLYPHCFRHYATTYLVKAGLSTTLIKELYGWSDEKMVSIYTDMDAKDRKWDDLDNLKNKLNS